MTQPKPRTAWLAGAVFASLLLAAAAGLKAAPAGSGGATPNRIDRQITVMETMIGRVLVDSPNWLVRGSDAVQGLYLPDYGAVFVVDASLTSNRFGNVVIGPGSHFELLRDDSIVIRREKSGPGGLFSARDKKEKEKDQDPAKLYEQGKAELLQMFADYPEALSALPGGQSVVLVLRVGKGVFSSTDLGISRLTMRVKSDDLKALADGRIQESDLKSRIQVEETKGR